MDSPLSRALLTLGHRHTALAITKPVTPVIGEFQVNINDAVRPYRVLNIADFVTATTEAITNPALTQTYRSLLRSAGQGPTEEAR